MWSPQLKGLTVLGLALTASASCQTRQNSTAYDYIVVGGGPSGIITAERLAEANKNVLLLERGYGPTVSTGANETLSWNETLTNIDLPGLSFDVGSLPQWEEYICTDTEGYAACVLGGGVTVNYMVFVHPPSHDFEKWPQGWNWDDISAAADRLYERNPGTTSPSADGEHYDSGLYEVLSGFLGNLGWKSVDMIEQPNEKTKVYSYPSWNIKDEKRAGPVRTYLPLAQQYDNFNLRLGTKVIRVVRSGSQVTGVEVETASGDREIISLASDGRVVLSAGSLSTPRVLFNSGIGPKAQIETAAKTNVTLPDEKDWIELPVGQTLLDHPIFAVQVQTNGTWGPLDAASILNGTDVTDIDLYENQNSGVLTHGKHRIIAFTSNNASDGVTRYYQMSCAPTDTGVVTITAYLTHGLTSSGVLGLDETGKTVIEKTPYLQTAGDIEAAGMFLTELIGDLQDAGFELLSSTNATDYLSSPSMGDHFMGTAKIGTDDGRYNGTAVVDTNTKVYGMDNLFISDASIHPDLPSGNSQAIVMVVAEAAVAKILAYQG